MGKIRIFYGLLSFLTLILGIVIYLLLRDINNIILFCWIPDFEFTKTVYMQIPPTLVSNLLKYNLPDMLWFLSGILFFRCVWFLNIKIQNTYIIFFYGSGLIFEISQLSEKIPGTFDLLDLLFMGIGAFVESLLYNNFVRRSIV
jgi:hypothetical protein